MRITCLAFLALPLASSCSAFFERSAEVDPESTAASVYALEVESLEGESVPLERYAGNVALIVNTASKCGYTPQYEGLQALHDTYGERGFVVLGFPSADFGGQEYSSAAEIREFCSESYAVSFPLFATSGVKAGESQSPVFAMLAGATGSLPGWNFGKYLVDRDGHAIEFFDTRTTPAEIGPAIERALGEG